MKKLYEETKKYINDSYNSAQVDLNTKLLGLWWTLWILNGIIGQIIYRLSKNADTLPELITTTTLDIINGVIAVGLGIVTIRVIKDYSNIEGLLETEE